MKITDVLLEFAPGGGDNGGNYLKALASAWYNDTYNTGDLNKGIKSQEDVERILERGIHCGDGKIRKYMIGYNHRFDGVDIQSDDHYEYADYDDAGRDIDSRTGQPWGPYDVVEFSGNELDESVAEGEVVQFPKKHRGDLSSVNDCPKCGGDLQGGKYQGHEVKVCMPCKQVYLPPNSGIDQQGNPIKEDADAHWIPDVVKLLGKLVLSSKAQAKYNVEPEDIPNIKEFINLLSAGNLDAARDHWSMMEWNDLDNALEYFVRRNGLPHIQLHDLLGEQGVAEGLKDTVKQKAKQFGKYMTEPDTPQQAVVRDRAKNIDKIRKNKEQGVAEGYSLGKVLTLPELLDQIKHILTAKHPGIGWRMTMPAENTFLFSAQNDYDVWSMLVVEASGDDWITVGHGMVDPDGKPIIFDRQQLPMTLASASEIADEAIQTYHDIDLSDYADDEDYNQGVAEGDVVPFKQPVKQNPHIPGFVASGSTHFMDKYGKRAIQKLGIKIISVGGPNNDADAGDKSAQDYGHDADVREYYIDATPEQVQKLDAYLYQAAEMSGDEEAYGGTYPANDFNAMNEQGVAEGKKKSEPPEADYGDDYQDMVLRLKKLAGAGPLKTVYDPAKRVYRNMPTATQPKK